MKDKIDYEKFAEQYNNEIKALCDIIYAHIPEKDIESAKNLKDRIADLGSKLCSVEGDNVEKAKKIYEEYSKKPEYHFLCRLAQLAEE